MVTSFIMVRSCLMVTFRLIATFTSPRNAHVSPRRPVRSRCSASEGENIDGRGISDCLRPHSLAAPTNLPADFSVRKILCVHIDVSKPGPDDAQQSVDVAGSYALLRNGQNVGGRDRAADSAFP